MGRYPVAIPVAAEPRPISDSLRLRDDIQFRVRLAEAIDPNDTALRVGHTVHGVGPRTTWWPTSVGAFATGLRLAISHERDGIPLPPSVVHCNVQRAAVASVWARPSTTYAVPVEFLSDVVATGVGSGDCAVIGWAVLLRALNRS